MQTPDSSEVIPPVSAERRRWRRPLLIAGPAVAGLIVLGLYLFGGRYVDTDDAYIKADKVNISAEVTGPIAEVLIAENQHVARGDALVQLDRRPFEVAVQQAQANLLQTRLQLESLRATYAQKASALSTAQTDMSYQQTQQKRVHELFGKEVVSRAALDTAKRDLDVSRSHLAELEHDLNEARVQLNGDVDRPAEQHPAFLAAKAALDKAQLDLDRTTVRAPIAGVASKVPEPGTYAMPGMPLLSVVAGDDAWIEANFKESELERIRAGQRVSIEIDAYPSHAWQGDVVSIGQATGAEFSLLPAQNASGNWVKVVQRIPVRIHIQHAADEPELRAGMSAEISVDTGHTPRAARMLSALGIGKAAAAETAASAH